MRNLRNKNIKYQALTLILAAAFFIACQGAATKDSSEIKQVSVQETNEAVAKENVQFIDVRTVEEYKSGHAPKAVNMPLDSLDKEFTKLDKSKPVYVICQTGRRSQKASEMLKQADFKDVYNVTGGTSAWASANLPLEK